MSLDGAAADFKDGYGNGDVEETVALTDATDSAALALALDAGGIPSPFRWLALLCRQLHWSFALGVIAVNGLSQGVGSGVWRVAGDYYWKDVQRVQPAAAQMYGGVSSLPWMVKPIWGIFTDVLPVAGYRRRPYLILSGLMGVIAMLTISLHSKLHVFFAVLAFMAGNASTAISDATMDACIAHNSILFPHLAPDIFSLTDGSEAVGKIIGFSISGLLVRAIGPQGALGSLSIPAALVCLVGLVLREDIVTVFPYDQAFGKFVRVGATMLATLKRPAVWRPCIYMFMSLALSLDIQEGLFYWYTDSVSGPSFSEDLIGVIYAIGSAGSLLGVVLYQSALKQYQFRSMLFWSQLFLGVAGMLDVIMVLRLNLKLGIADYLFAVIDEVLFQLVSQLKWMPLLVLSTKLCPDGIEGTFFALLMSIDNVGSAVSSWGGGVLLHLLRITRSEFKNLWVAILVRNAFRLLPLCLLFLVPLSEQSAAVLDPQRKPGTAAEGCLAVDDVELVGRTAESSEVEGDESEAASLVSH